MGSLKKQLAYFSDVVIYKKPITKEFASGHRCYLSKVEAIVYKEYTVLAEFTYKGYPFFICKEHKKDILYSNFVIAVSGSANKIEDSVNVLLSKTEEQLEKAVTDLMVSVSIEMFETALANGTYFLMYGTGE
jgi:hypothetical protein